MAFDRLVYSRHALTRMLQRGISETDVANVLASGQLVEVRAQDEPLPTYVVAGGPVADCAWWRLMTSQPLRPWS